MFSTFQIAWRAICANKVRTGLAILGIVIGIASVIVVFSAGEGIRNLVLKQVQDFGTNFIETEIKAPSNKKGMAAESQSAASIAQGVQITTLKLDDLEDIDKLPNINKSYAGIMGQEQVSYGNELYKSFLLGVSASYIEIDKSEIDSGRFYTEAEDHSLAKVAVLGSKMKKKLFGDSDPIGKSIKIRKTKYRIIGVMKERGAIMGMDFDEMICIPVRTVMKRILGVNHVLYMMHEIENLALAEDTAEQIRAILRENHEIEAISGEFDISKDDFRVVTMTEMQNVLGEITGALTMLLLAIVAISLVVGGVGILNIMYVIVNERTKEIGLRKAIGARYIDIMGQFLIESTFITTFGGIVGVILGIIISFLISIGAQKSGLDWEFSIPLRSFVIALGFSAFFGIVFGVYPAQKAAQLNPIEALNKE